MASWMGRTNRRGIAGLTTWRREISYSWVQMGAVPGRSKPRPFKYYALPKMTTLWRRYCECFNLHRWCGCTGCRTKCGINVNVISWVVANVKRNNLTQANRSNRLCYRIMAERRHCECSWFSGRSYLYDAIHMLHFNAMKIYSMTTESVLNGIVRYSTISGLFFKYLLNFFFLFCVWKLAQYHARGIRVDGSDNIEVDWTSQKVCTNYTFAQLTIVKLDI